MPTLIQNAKVLTFDEKRRELDGADVLVEGRTIKAVGQSVPVPDGPGVRVIDGRGKLVMPGLVNAHLHSPANLLKGAMDDAPLEIFMLYEVPPMGDTPESARINYLRTQLGAVEMLKLGITSVHDDAFFNPVPTTETIDAVMAAYRDAGMRATVALDQPNVAEYEKFPFLEDLLPDAVKAEMRAAPLQSEPELMGIYQDFLSRWHGADDGRLRCSVSCSAPQRVTPSYLQSLTELSRQYDLPFNIHILETRLQRVLGQEKFGGSLIRYVHELGALDERKLVIHAIWIDEDDIALLAEAGSCVAHNPISNLKIGSGVMPFRALRDAGIPIAIGTDEAAVDDSANVWSAAKFAALVQRGAMADWTRWPKAPEVLDCVIKSGARSMRQEDRIGQISPGFDADLIMIDLDTIAFTPLNDMHRQLVYCENGSSVVLTMVAGQIVVENGQVLTVDEAALKAEVRASMDGHAETFARIHAHAERLMPFYRAMTDRAQATPIGPMVGTPGSIAGTRDAVANSQPSTETKGRSDG
ncbi:MAG: amidohydrolase family protein [Pseudomonadota bacterium]